MSWINLAIAVVVAASAEEVIVRPGETLDQIAKRTLGDERAGAELKALNGVTSDRVAPGTALRLPGPERVRALSALAAARNAVSQASSSADQREASASLNKAEELFEAARYEESAAEADSAWRLLSGPAQQNTRFAVQVEDGETKVTSRAGRPVRVEREGVTQPVFPGQTLTIPKQAAQGVAPAALTAPVLLAPSDLARVRVRPSEKGLGPVMLSWQSVPGAARYDLDIVPLDGTAGTSLAVQVDKPEAHLPLSAGKYGWTVRAISPKAERSDPSARRTFELWVEPLKLEVKGTNWK